MRLFRIEKGTTVAHLNVLLGIPKLLLDEGDICLGTLLRRVERAHVRRERLEEGPQDRGGRTRRVRRNEPGRPGRGHRADLSE